MNIKLMKNFSKYLVVLLLTALFFSASAFAQTPTEGNTSPSVTPTSAPTPTPVGQVLSLDLKIPGIGSSGENQTPQHKTREVSIYFFSPEVNTEDSSTTPVSAFVTTVNFDSNPDSPTYGNFVNPLIDLGDKIENGRYQIVVKTDQTLSKLIKSDKEEGPGGQIFEIGNSYNKKIELTGLTMLPGDIYPSPKGDNVMDINDYNGLVNCFGSRGETEACTDKILADLDDNGTVDGTDYNIMFGSFRVLLSLGLPVPTFVPGATTKMPTVISKPSPTEKPAKSTPAPAIKKSESSSGGIQVAIFIVIVMVLSGLVIFKRRKLKSFIEVLLHKQSKGVRKDDGPEKEEGIDQNVEKEFYVKKQTYDDVNKTTVLTLTDDSGPTLGYYSGGEVVDGFAKVKGIMKKDGDKVYIDVSAITPVDQAA